MTTTDRTGEIRATEDFCRVIMATKTPEGQSLSCGNSAPTCSRRTHQVKQLDGSPRAEPGVYEGVLNASKKGVDGIVETFISFTDRELQSKATLAQMEETIHQSAQKEDSEAQYHPKTPSVLTFNLEEQPPASTPSQGEQMRNWRDTLGDHTAASPVLGTPNPGSKTDPIPISRDDSKLAETLGHFAGAMAEKLEMWQSQQERLSQKLINEVRDVVARHKAEDMARPPPDSVPARSAPEASSERRAVPPTFGSLDHPNRIKHHQTQNVFTPLSKVAIQASSITGKLFWFL
jgi:hypothetical protein